MLRDLPPAARGLILTGPLFAPTALAAPFAVAYQDALGLTAPQIGLLGAAVTGLGFVFLLAGSEAARRWGRLRAMTLFDVLGFVVPALGLALARTPAEVVAAALLGATAQGAQAGFQGLLFADLAPAQRPRAAALEHLLLILPSLAMPLLAGALVGAWGLAPAVRALYVVSAASVAAMVAARWVLLRGAAPAAGPLPPGLADLRGLARAARRAGLGPILGASALVGLAGGLGVLMQLRVLEVLRLEAWWLGPLGFAGAAADVVASAAAARAGAARAWAAGGALAGAAGAALFLAAADAALVLASGALLGAAGAVATLGLTAMLHDAVPDALRDRAVVLQQAARALAALAGMALAGALFARDPGGPWVVATVVGLAAVALVGWDRFVRRRAGWRRLCDGSFRHGRMRIR